MIGWMVDSHNDTGSEWPLSGDRIALARDGQVSASVHGVTDWESFETPWRLPL